MARQRAKERACETAIKKTLAYRASFNYPLSFHQLATFLETKRDFDYLFFKKTLKKLVKSKVIRVKKGKYYAPFIKPVSWNFRMKETKKILARNLYVLKTLQLIPWIKMIGITGSIGAYNATKKDDIDIFIITANNRLWITRLFLVTITKVLNKYPTKYGEKEKICPNIMIDEKNMSWPKTKRNIYVANEIASLQPICDKNCTYFRFIKANSWITKHLGNFKVNTTSTSKNPHRRSEVLDKLDYWAMQRQISYMAKKRTKEIVRKGFIHFNVSDSAPKSLRSYKNNLKKLRTRKKRQINP
jgi:hypothetical protein